MRTLVSLYIVLLVITCNYALGQEKIKQEVVDGSLKYSIEKYTTDVQRQLGTVKCGSGESKKSIIIEAAQELTMSFSMGSQQEVSMALGLGGETSAFSAQIQLQNKLLQKSEIVRSDT